MLLPASVVSEALTSERDQKIAVVEGKETSELP